MTTNNKNYNKTKIYKIWSLLGDKIYIGSTTKEYLSQRMTTHRYSYQSWKRTNKNKISSFILFDEYGIENCLIELLEAKECKDIHEARQLEGGYIRTLECVNKVIAGRSVKDSRTEYYNNNKEKILNKQREYNKNNKEKILNQRREYNNNNKEELLNQKREYYNNNKEELLNKQREYRKNNKEELLNQKREYYNNNKEDILNKQREYRKKRKEQKITNIII